MTTNNGGVAVYPHVTGKQPPADDTAVTAALRAVMALDEMQQVAFAARLTSLDARMADGLGELLLGAVGLTMPPPPRPPSERFGRRLEALADFTQWAALDDDDDVVYEYALGSAQ